MDLKSCTKLDLVKKKCPDVFRGHQSNFKVTRTEKSMILIQCEITRRVAAIKSLRFALFSARQAALVPAVYISAWWQDLVTKLPVIFFLSDGDYTFSQVECIASLVPIVMLGRLALLRFPFLSMDQWCFLFLWCDVHQREPWYVFIYLSVPTMPYTADWTVPTGGIAVEDILPATVTDPLPIYAGRSLHTITFYNQINYRMRHNFEK